MCLSEKVTSMPDARFGVLGHKMTNDTKGSQFQDTQGVLAPLLVRELESSKCEIVAGARRLRAEGPGSRHLNSQTSGPPCRSVRIMLPICMDSSFCAFNAEIAEQDLQAQFRHRLSMRKGKNRNKSRKVIASCGDSLDKAGLLEQGNCMPFGSTTERSQVFG
jgi:hypothetical protein